MGSCVTLFKPQFPYLSGEGFVISDLCASVTYLIVFLPQENTLPNGLKVAYKYAYEAVIEKRRSKAKEKQIELGIRL